MDKTNDILDQKQLAEIFNCSVQTIQREARRGNLPARKVGRYWFSNKSIIEGFQFLQKSGRK